MSKDNKIKMENYEEGFNDVVRLFQFINKVDKYKIDEQIEGLIKYNNKMESK